MPNRKYTFEILSPLVALSLSYAEVLRRLGLKQTGGSQANIKRLVLEYRISTKHFLGRARNRGSEHRGGTKKAEAKEILVLREPLAHPEKAYKLRRAMLDVGIPYICSLCGIKDIWNNKTLRLAVDHINGRRNDNRRENLRFLCPNCHSQTETFGNNFGLTDVAACSRRDRYYRQKRKQSAAKK